MKVVVTGGAGFIGSHVCDAFLAHGHEVIALDNLSSGKKANLDTRVRLAPLDIRSRDAARLIESDRPQIVCLLAAQMDVRRSVADPSFDAEVNIVGMLNVLEACRKGGAKKVIFSSTGGAIYGEQEHFPAGETHPTRPVSPYGVSKAAGELYLGYYRAQYGLEYVALRYSNVYGPRQNSHGEAGVVAIFSERLINGQPCIIYGDGGQGRDFVYCTDVANANYRAFEGSFVGPVNIGTGLETDVNTLYRLLAEALGSKASARHEPAKPGEQRRSVIDNSLARRVLGWSPTVAIADGLKLTVDSFRLQAAR